MPRIKNASNSPVKGQGVVLEGGHAEEGCTPRVVGSRIGTAKSSGLLADDRKSNSSQEYPSADGYAFMTSGLTDDVSSQTTGRNMYSFQKSSRGPSAKEAHVQSAKASPKQTRKISNGACKDKKPVRRTARRSARVLSAKERVHREESSASDEEAGAVEAGGSSSEASSDTHDKSGKRKRTGASTSRRMPARYEQVLFFFCFFFRTILTNYLTCHELQSV